MDVLDVIRKRRSVRSYGDQPVAPDALERILEAARLAPSAANRQERRFVVVTEANRRAALAEACAAQGFVAQAPVVIAGCAEVSTHKAPTDADSHLIDLVVAMTQMTLQAVAERLGTCWVTGFDEHWVKEILKAPRAARVVALLTVGHSEGKPRPFSRLPLDSIVHRETWQRPIPPS